MVFRIWSEADRTAVSLRPPIEPCVPFGIRLLPCLCTGRFAVRPKAQKSSLFQPFVGEGCFHYHGINDTLVLGCTFPTAGQARDLHPLETCARRAHCEKYPRCKLQRGYVVHSDYRYCLTSSEARATSSEIVMVISMSLSAANLAHHATNSSPAARSLPMVL